ncbi:MAG: HDIG domain-containing protein [Paramuribaculum sp.]|nr:HDIG domain-containing protein [Paramuribaculum sp.]
MDYRSIIDRYYPAGSAPRDIYMRHCEAVAAKALDIAAKCKLDLNPDDIRAAAMLHDIGIFATNATSICCNGTEPYIRHGIIGSELLRREGCPEEIAAVAERHTGAGLTAEEIASQNLPLPHADLCPRTTLEQLICYADKFFSKSGDMKEKDIAQVRKSLERFGSATMQRFEDMHREFTHCGTRP